MGEEGIKGGDKLSQLHLDSERNEERYAFTMVLGT